MSRNDQFIILKTRQKVYGWDVQAEAWCECPLRDHKIICKGCSPIINLSDADAIGDTKEDVYNDLLQTCGTPEYGTSYKPVLVKDGRIVKVEE